MHDARFYRLPGCGRDPIPASRDALGTLPMRAVRYCEAVTMAGGCGRICSLRPTCRSGGTIRRSSTSSMTWRIGSQNRMASVSAALTAIPEPGLRGPRSMTPLRVVELIAASFGLAGMALGSTRPYGIACYAVAIPCLIYCVYRTELWSLLTLNIAQGVVIAVNAWRVLKAYGETVAAISDQDSPARRRPSA